MHQLDRQTLERARLHHMAIGLDIESVDRKLGDDWGGHGTILPPSTRPTRPSTPATRFATTRRLATGTENIDADHCLHYRREPGRKRLAESLNLRSPRKPRRAAARGR